MQDTNKMELSKTIALISILAVLIGLGGVLAEEEEECIASILSMLEEAEE